MKKTIIIGAFLASVGLQAQIALPTQQVSTNSNVGIGTTSPGARLQINGAGTSGGLLINTIEVPDVFGGTTTSDYIFKAHHNGNNRVFIGIDGRITAGSSVFNFANANSMLNIDKSLGVFYTNTNFFKVNYPTLGSGLSLLWNNSQTGVGSELTFRFGTNNSAPAVMTLSPTGNISFGNTAPTERFQVYNSSNTNILNLTDNGYMSLGASTPTERFQIFNTGNTNTLNFTDNGHLAITNTDPNINYASQTNLTYGLSIVNSGWRNHDYAFSITTGHGKLFTVSNGGTVHIGQGQNFDIPDPLYKLWVKGGIRAEKVRVDVAANNGWADYVFDDDYQLMSLEELEASIKKNGHLPGVPSAEQVAEEGMDVAEMNKILLEKIEELTLHLIEMNKKLQDYERS